MAVPEPERDEVIFPLNHITTDGRYEMREKLGQGGMGVVHRAFDRVLGVDVAIKFQMPGADSKEKIFFKREARAMARLNGCMNIVGILNIGTCDRETPNGPETLNYIAFEYMKGGSALDMLVKAHDEKQVSLPYVVSCIKMGIEASNGLARAHDAGILHRDVKPSNLLLRQSGTVKVSDFGLAKITTDITVGLEDPTAKGYGTQSYMAPEQFNPDHEPNHKIDIWQLGATLYHLLTGRLPRPDFQNPSEINQHIPKGVSDYVLKMLSINPNARPADCTQVAEALQMALDLLDTKKRLALRTEIIHLEQFQNIRHALKEKVEKGLEALITPEEVILPRRGEKPTWYATLLMRPFQQNIDGSKMLLDTFNPIYFAHYEGRRLVAFSDWEKDANLIAKSLGIFKCCSGLPIRWYHEKGSWEDNRKHFDCQTDEHNFIRYFALKNIKWARFEDKNDNLIKQTYATDKARDNWPQEVGWDLETENGDEKPMSQSIETEILIPIYNPFSKGKFGNASTILGIANFEWEEKFSDDRIREVGKYLAMLIQEDNRFALSEFTCDVLPNITLSDYEEGPGNT
jgi:serine/threonine protein kinase